MYFEYLSKYLSPRHRHPDVGSQTNTQTPVIILLFDPYLTSLYSFSIFNGSRRNTMCKQSKTVYSVDSYSWKTLVIDVEMKIESI